MYIFVLFLVEIEKKAPLCTLLHLVAAALGIICIGLASVVIALSIHCKSIHLFSRTFKTE